MKVAQRILYFSGGFIIGLFLLFFFLGGKKASCDYSPTARVLKNIRLKKKQYSQNALSIMRNHNIDSATIAVILNKGSVDFSNSNTKLDSCKTYVVKKEIDNKNLELHIKNCDSIANIYEVKVSN